MPLLQTKQETKIGTPISANYVSNVLSVLLQTADILLENSVNKKQVRTKVLFYQGLQRYYVTQRIRNFLDLKIISQNTIFTFMSKTTESSALDRVSITLKGASNFEFCIKAMCTPFVCLPIKNQSISFQKNNYDQL